MAISDTHAQVTGAKKHDLHLIDFHTCSSDLSFLFYMGSTFVWYCIITPYSFFLPSLLERRKGASDLLRY